MSNFLHSRLVKGMEGFVARSVEALKHADKFEVVYGRDNIDMAEDSTVLDSCVSGKLVVGHGSIVSRTVINDGCTVIVGDNCVVLGSTFKRGQGSCNTTRIVNGSKVLGSSITGGGSCIDNSVVLALESSDAGVVRFNGVFCVRLKIYGTLDVECGSVIMSVSMSGGKIDVGKNCVIGLGPEALLSTANNLSMADARLESLQESINNLDVTYLSPYQITAVRVGDCPAKLRLSIGDDSVLAADIVLHTSIPSSIGKRFRLTRCTDRRSSSGRGSVASYMSVTTGVLTVGSDVVWQLFNSSMNNYNSSAQVELPSGCFGMISVPSGTNVLQMSAVADYRNCRVSALPGQKLIL